MKQQKKQQKKQQIQIQMNNKPITARVKSGMFKTKEPLLNVGPAGVDGNNTTRTMPSPSKMKGYKMKSSPFKQNTDNAETSANTENTETIRRSEADNQGVVVDTKITNQTPDTEGTPDVVTKKPYVGAANDACSAQYIAANGRAKCDEYEALPQKVKDEANTTTVKGTKGTPGTDGDKDVKKKAIIEKVARKGEASSAYATRNNLRKAKVAARNAKKYQRKQDRADRRKDPTLDAKKQRHARKEAAAQEIKKVADSELRNSQIQSKQGKYGFGNNKDIVLDDVNVQQGEKTDTRQRELGTPAEMNKPGFFKKKSPMKMNYFKK